MAITKEQIFAVAEELDAAGQNPTLAVVRKAIGGGSFTTISEAMSEWRNRKAAREAPIREPAPQLVVDRLAEFGAEIWAAALELANARLASEREGLETARSQLESEKREAAELADQVSAELESLQARVAGLETSEKAARAEAAVLSDKLSKASERAATAEARAEEISKRADDLKAALDAARDASALNVAELNAELSRINAQNAELVRALADAAKGSGWKA